MCNSPLRTEQCDITELGFEIARYGCVSAEELKCHEPCGKDPTCEDPGSSSSSDGETETEATTLEPSTTTEGETEGETETTTGPGPECTGNEACLDPALPFCVGEVCSPCSAVVEETPDEACAGLDEATPLCVEDACVQCTAESAEACGGGTPICDEAESRCVACRFHEECQDIGLPACNIATGACFSADAVTEVNAGVDDTIQPAIDAVADGAEHVIRLTAGGQNHTVTIDGGKTIALVSASDNPTIQQEVRGNSGNPTLTVTGAGTTVYVHRVALTANTDDVGIAVGPAATLYADSTRVAQNTGGGITLGAGSFGFLRNCMVGGSAADVSAVLVSG